MKRNQIITFLALSILTTGYYFNKEGGQNEVSLDEDNLKSIQKSHIVRMPGSDNSSGNADVNNQVDTNKKRVDLSRLKSNKDRINYYFNCLEYQQCETIPSHDPRMYEIEVGQRIVGELKELYEQSDLDGEERELVKKSMHALNGHVQAEALAFYYDFERTPENLQEVVQGLKNSEFDVVLIDKAMPLLKEYFDRPETRDDVFRYVSSQVQNGSYLSSEYFAKKINTFITEDNVNEIEDIVRDLSPDKHTHKYIKSALDNFKMMQNGG